jgi:Kdo2-lipid IVA lauroyltransferase/acyltransferase
MYYIVYGIFWLVSLLPLRLLYFLSDIIYVFVFYISRYRRDVVMNNLLIAFPGKTERERLLIAKKFYHNMVDTIVETVKLFTASEKFIQKHFTGNWELINNIKPSGRKVHLHIGHNFNWEWGNAAAGKKLSLPFIAVYLPLSNKIFERMFVRLRSRNGTLLVRATHMQEDLLPYRNEQYLLGLAADQNPGSLTKALWFNFFDRPTPFLNQPAKHAIRNDCIVVFGFIHKKRRGYYDVVFSIAEENPRNVDEVDLTRRFVRHLEDVIRQYPDMWLWSHRRWRHEWKEGYTEIIN